MQEKYQQIICKSKCTV